MGIMVFMGEIIMSKEYLEAWNFIKDQMQNFTFSHLVSEMVKNADIVEHSLQRLEAIDNSEPNKSLKNLEVLEKTISPLLEPILAEYEDDLSDKITANYFVLKQTLIKSQEDKRFIELILNKPQLLNVFALDGIHTWEEFEDTFSDEDKEYINTTKEEYEYMRNQLIKRGKIDE